MSLVKASREGPVAILTLNRPEKLNALSTALEEELDTLIDSDLVRESDVVVFAGEGRAFSAGADVTEMHGATPEAILAYYRRTGDVYERVAALSQPTIAAIHGYCLGGGFELALACDFRVADVTSTFGLPEVALGILPSSGGTVRLVRAIGPARAKELLLIRDRLGVDEAFRFGLVTLVAPEGEALARAVEMAGELARLPTHAVRLVKQTVDVLPEASREAGLMIERLGYVAMSQTPAHKEATTGFVADHAKGSDPNEQEAR
jgi:enoyl-CoA hydratase/carnithine racemase